MIFFFFVLQKILIHYPNQDKLHKFDLNRSILQHTHLEMEMEQLQQVIIKMEHICQRQQEVAIHLKVGTRIHLVEARQEMQEHITIQAVI